VHPPGVIRSFFLAASSLLEDLGAFVVGNFLFGLSLLIVAVATQLSLVGYLLLIPLAMPAAAVMRMATVHVRSGTARISTFGEGLRRPWRVMGVAATEVLLAFLFGADISLGWAQGSLVGSALAVAGFYGLLALWTYVLVLWPLLLDPEADAYRFRYLLRVAAFVVVSRPLRALALAFLVLGLLAVSVGSILGILTIGWALACLASAHWVLPTADALLGRAAGPAGE
jgi:hypothetical protein